MTEHLCSPSFWYEGVWECPDCGQWWQGWISDLSASQPSMKYRPCPAPGSFTAEGQRISYLGAIPIVAEETQ